MRQKCPLKFMGGRATPSTARRNGAMDALWNEWKYEDFTPKKISGNSPSTTLYLAGQEEMMFEDDFTNTCGKNIRSSLWEDEQYRLLRADREQWTPLA
jgi:hypothetical protein